MKYFLANLVSATCVIAAACLAFNSCEEWPWFLFAAYLFHRILNTPVKVFSQGMPPDSLWVEPPNTWDDIMAGKVLPAGLFIRASDAKRLIDELIISGPKVADWHGSEGGTPRVTFDTWASQRAHERNPLPCGDDIESDFERRERIADEIADRKFDRRIDNDNTTPLR